MGKDENWSDALNRLVNQGSNNGANNNGPSFGTQDEQRESPRFGTANIEEGLEPSFKQRIELFEKDIKKNRTHELFG